VNALFHTGRYLFALSIAFFGLQYLTYGQLMGGLPPVPPWAPGGRTAAYLTGILLLAVSAGMASSRYARLCAFVFGSFFILCVLILHTPHWHDILYNGTDRTRAFEPLALGAAAFVLAGAFGGDASLSLSKASWRPAVLSGRIVFALCLVVFGWQHFRYVRFLVTLVPAWIPWHGFWIYFTGTAFVAVGLAMLTGILERLGLVLLGLMFALWFVVLHLPRALVNVHHPDEWTSAFVALAMCGACWFMAATPRNA
jgi:uncharacterized membrane protein